VCGLGRRDLSRGQDHRRAARSTAHKVGPRLVMDSRIGQGFWGSARSYCQLRQCDLEKFHLLRRPDRTRIWRSREDTGAVRGMWQDIDEQSDARQLHLCEPSLGGRPFSVVGHLHARLVPVDRHHILLDTSESTLYQPFQIRASHRCHSYVLAHHARRAMKATSRHRRVTFSTCAIVSDAGTPDT
jgi:hypothetical protein